MVKKAKMENGGHLDVGASKRFETMRDYSKDCLLYTSDAADE